MTDSVIVLGGGGFLGRAVLRALSGAKVTRLGCADLKVVRVKNVASRRVDILDFATLERVCRPYEVIINCIGQITEPIDLCRRLNTEGVENIARVALKQKKRVIQISTVMVYGRRRFADEKTALAPKEDYARCKLRAEQILQEALPQNKLVILRSCNLFGPGQQGGLVVNLMRARKDHRPFCFDSNGQARRYFLHVFEAAGVIAAVVHNPRLSGIYNLVGPESYRIKELVQYLEDLTGEHFKVRYTHKDAPTDLKNLSGARLKKKLKINFRESFKKFLKEEFIRQNYR